MRKYSLFLVNLLKKIERPIGDEDARVCANREVRLDWPNVYRAPSIFLFPSFFFQGLWAAVF